TEAFKNLGREDILTAFAVKSCSNINVLKILADLGAGADIVSEGEMRRALKANIPAEKIMFSGVGKSKQEIIYALKHKIGVINVESEPELELIAKTAQELNVTAPISLRVNPDVVAKTLPGISTGKKGDKFGIALDLVRDVYKKASKMAAIDLKGLDFHIGSQVFDVEEFRPAFEKVRKLLCDIRSEDGLAVTHIDCGGGLGVPYHPHETPPNMQDYAKLVLDYFGDLEVKLAFEPGRFISGNAGILVSKLLYEKQDSDEWCCLIIDAAMNDLARPAIYGAYHHIVPVQDNTTKPIKKYDIVGPVCESTDTFAKNYTFPQLGQGDLVAFLTAGAYGATMSSHYNTRLDAPEVLVEKGAFHIIKRRPTYDTLFELEMI
ncbi:MAG: diaminopimelate decarboxylase, partial [Pseudomonadota bacterium]